MSAKLNIATAADLATKEAYINTDLVDAYIQENEDGLGNKTYTLSFIKKDEEDPNLSEVVELDYARASEVAAARDFYEMRVVVTDNLGVLTTVSEYGDAALLGLEDGVKPELVRVDTGLFKFESTDIDLSTSQVQVGSFEGVSETIDGQTFKTKTITSSGAGLAATFVDANNLLTLTNIILTVPKSVVDALPGA